MKKVLKCMVIGLFAMGLMVAPAMAKGKEKKAVVEKCDKAGKPCKHAKKGEECKPELCPPKDAAGPPPAPDDGPLRTGAP